VDGDVDGPRMARERLEGKTRRCKLKPIEAAAKPLVNGQARLIFWLQRLAEPSRAAATLGSGLNRVLPCDEPWIPSRGFDIPLAQVEARLGLDQRFSTASFKPTSSVMAAFALPERSNTNALFLRLHFLIP
jgi:hypothetical protein